MSRCETCKKEFAGDGQRFCRAECDPGFGKGRRAQEVDTMSDDNEEKVLVPIDVRARHAVLKEMTVSEAERLRAEYEANPLRPIEIETFHRE